MTTLRASTAMNAITNALKDLRFKIPIELLNAAFISKVHHRTHIPISLDARIRELVLDPRVMKDCNLVGGTMETVDLSGCPVQYIDLYSAVYTVPKPKTQGRTITRALDISYGPGIAMGSNYSGVNQGSATVQAAGMVLQSNGPIPMVATASVMMVGENTVMISDVNVLPMSIYLRCWLEHDSEMSTMQPTTYSVFSKLVEYAVKSFIYLTMQVPMDIGEIHAGALLGRFKDVVDSYADAEANYETLRDGTWQRVAKLNDFSFKKRHITTVVGMIGQ